MIEPDSMMGRPDTSSGEPLDNVVWHALTSSHRHLAVRAGNAARYRADVSPFFAVDQLDGAAWDDLAALAGQPAVVVLFRDEVPTPPSGWEMLWQGQCHQMVADRPLDGGTPPPPGIRSLTDDDVEAMLELVQLTKPGPFAARTIELGGYLGVVEGGRLLAMAGERMACPGYAEVSAVCTHPDAQGRGYAAALTAAVAANIQARGDTPFLHVEVNNHTARRVYERVGMRTRRLVDVVVLRAPTGDR